MEKLLRFTELYFDTSCQNIVFDRDGNLLNTDGAVFNYTLYSGFDSYCFTASMLMGRGSYVEARLALSKACALVERILRAEHPRTLACFLEVLIHLIQTGQPEITSILRGFIKGIFENFFNNGKPWGQIFQLLGELDSEQLDQAIAKVWKCTTEVFARNLGANSRLAVSVYLDYIKRVVTDPIEEGRLLRALLAQLGDDLMLPTPRVMLNFANNLKKQYCYSEAEEMALKVSSLIKEHGMYASRTVERIESLKIISFSQFSQGKSQAAETNIRVLIGLIIQHWGRHLSWVIKFMCMLEG